MIELTNQHLLTRINEIEQKYYWYLTKCRTGINRTRQLKILHKRANNLNLIVMDRLAKTIAASYD